MSQIKITLPDGSTRSFESGITPLDIASDIGERLANDVVCAKIDGVLSDLSTPISQDVEIALFDGRSPEGHDVLLHSTAHLMAQAVMDLYPDVQITIGPTIENGFFYDFDFSTPFSEEDLEKIELKMKEARSKK